jgi:hypothetical protein
MMKAVNFLLGSILALPLFAHADALKLQKSTQEFDQYRGQITVNGEYSYYFDDEVAGDFICFHPSAGRVESLYIKTFDTGAKVD